MRREDLAALEFPPADVELIGSSRRSETVPYKRHGRRRTQCRRRTDVGDGLQAPPFTARDTNGNAATSRVDAVDRDRRPGLDEVAVHVAERDRLLQRRRHALAW